MVKRGTSPRPSPHFAPLTSQNAEREKRSLRSGEIGRSGGSRVQGVNYSGTPHPGVAQQRCVLIAEIVWEMGSSGYVWKMVKRGTSPRPSPHFAPLTSQNAEREKRSLRSGEIGRSVGSRVQGVNYSGTPHPGVAQQRCVLIAEVVWEMGLEKTFWCNDSPHPGPLPSIRWSGEGETLAASWQNWTFDGSRVQGPNSQAVSGKTIRHSWFILG
jgi:hypothetical protein